MELPYFKILFKKVCLMKNKKRIYRNVKRKTKYTWAEEDLENTMFEVLSVPGTSILGVVKV